MDKPESMVALETARAAQAKAAERKPWPDDRDLSLIEDALNNAAALVVRYERRLFFPWREPDATVAKGVALQVSAARKMLGRLRREARSRQESS